MNIDQQIAALIKREGGYVDDTNDRGGPTCYGITEQVARAHGYLGSMKDLPESFAASIYRLQYWADPKFDLVEMRSAELADELLDTGVNMGPTVASRFLQRALNVLNRGATAYPDVVVDGSIGRMTLYALDTLIATRGVAAVTVLLRMLNAQQSVKYIELAEAKPSQEEFEYGWQLNRVA